MKWPTTFRVRFMYRNESIITKVRPIKKLCIINKGDIAKFFELIKSFSREIGGLLNIVLLNDGELFLEKRVEFVRRHDPDIIVNYSDCSEDKLYQNFKTNILNGNENNFEQGRVETPLMELSNKPILPNEILGHREVVYTNISQGIEEDKFAYYLNYGLIEDEEYLKSIDYTVFQDVEIKQLNSLKKILSTEEPFYRDNFLYLSVVGFYEGGYWTSVYRANYNKNDYYKEKPTIILGSSSNLRSMTYFWNTRATYPYNNNVWFPLKLADKYLGLLEDYSHYTTFSNDIDEPDKGTLSNSLDSLKEIDSSQYYFESIANAWEPFQNIENITITDNKFRVKHPSNKLFSKEGLNINVVLEVWGLDDVVLPKSLAVGELFRETPDKDLKPHHFSRISGTGLAICMEDFSPNRAKPLIAEITIPEDEEIFKTLIEERGICIERTKGSKATEQLINLVGGSEKLDIMADREIFELLVSITPERIKRIIKELSEEINKEIPHEQIKGSIRRNLDEILTIKSVNSVEANELPGQLPDSVSIENRERFFSKVQKLVNQDLLLRGKHFNCPYCGSPIWFLLSDIDEENKCTGCNNPVNIPLHLDGQVLSDSFRLNKLVANAVDQGVLPLLLTANFLSKQRYFGKRFLFEHNFHEKPTHDFLSEVDIIFSLGRKLGLSEVKADRGFSEDQADRLVETTTKLEGDIALFSSIKSRNSEEINDLYQYLDSKNLDVTTLIVTEEVLFTDNFGKVGKYFRKVVGSSESGPFIIEEEG